MRVEIEIGGGPDFERDAWIPDARDLQVFNIDPYYSDDPWRFRAERETGWPMMESIVDEVRASHVLEHIPAGEPRIRVFDEAWRVLKPGGLFVVDVPRFPNDAAVSDPTHVSYFVPDSFVYFTNPSVSGPSWKVWEIFLMHMTDATIHCELRKPE